MQTESQEIPSELPDRPWQKLAADVFELKGQLFLLVLDYFSRYVEVAKLSHTTSPDVVVHLKSMFARHGIPDQLVTGNGPQFSAHSFALFADEYAFTTSRSAPGTLKQMVKWNGWFKQWNTCWGKQKILIKFLWHTVPHPLKVESVQQSCWRGEKSALDSLPCQCN